MLNYELIENSYKITAPHSNNLIGYFVPDIDGFYYFKPEKWGYWNEQALLELGNKLKDLNQDQDYYNKLEKII